MVGVGGADLMKPRGGIYDLVKSGGRSGKSGSCGTTAHAESAVKPSSTESAQYAWIFVCGC
jgi:hypothetical protein